MSEPTDKMCKAARETVAGKLLDRLIADEIARGGDTGLHGGGSILEQLWKAMYAARDRACGCQESRELRHKLANARKQLTDILGE